MIAKGIVRGGFVLYIDNLAQLMIDIDGASDFDQKNKLVKIS